MAVAHPSCQASPLPITVSLVMDREEDLCPGALPLLIVGRIAAHPQPWWWGCLLPQPTGVGLYGDDHWCWGLLIAWLGAGAPQGTLAAVESRAVQYQGRVGFRP